MNDSNTPLHVHKATCSDYYCVNFSCSFVQMLLPSLMHILENIPHLVSTLLTSTVMGMSLGSLTVHTLLQPHVECQMLLEFAAKGELLQVSNCIQYGMLL